MYTPKVSGSIVLSGVINYYSDDWCIMIIAQNSSTIY